MSRPLTMPRGLSVALIDWPETRTCRPVRLPSASRPADELALRDRPVEVVRLVLLAAPDQLDRDAGEFLGDGGGLPGVVLRAAAPAEAAAEVVPVHLALGRAERRTPPTAPRATPRGSASAPRHSALSAVSLHGGVHHLHAGVREERRRIDRLDLLRRLVDRLQRIAVLAVAVGRGGGEAFLEHARRCWRWRRCRCRPRPRRSAARRAPSWRATRCRRRRRRRCRSTFTTFFTPGMPATFDCVEALHLAAEHRAVLDRGVQHAGQLDVDRDRPCCR